MGKPLFESLIFNIAQYLSKPLSYEYQTTVNFDELPAILCMGSMADFFG